MAEVTRVPLQPIAKGSLIKLWLGVLLAVLLAAGIAYAAMPKGVTVEEITAGEGPNPGMNDVVFIHYTGTLADGTVFDQSQDFPLPVEGILPKGTPMPLEGVVPGFAEALMQTQKGGKYKIFIPAEKGYGDDLPEDAPIPPGADLNFDVEVVDFMSREEAEQKVAMLRQIMMQQMQEQGGMPGGPAGAPGAPATPPAGQ